MMIGQVNGGTILVSHLLKILVKDSCILPCSSSLIRSMSVCGSSSSSAMHSHLLVFVATSLIKSGRVAGGPESSPVDGCENSEGLGGGEMVT